MKLKLELTAAEACVLGYLIYGADSGYPADPLKDIYEAGDIANEKGFDGYKALKTLAKKLAKAGV